MQFLPKPVRALFVLVPLLALAGCGGGSTQPSTAVNGPAGQKVDLTTKSADAPSETPQPEPDLLHPSFEIDTTAGKITVRLDAEKSPMTVDNFRNYVTHHHYDLTIFHQVVKTPVQIVLGGAYTADLKEKPPLTPIRNEAHNGLKNHRGTIAMLRRADDEDSATCQFFFNVADNNVLDFKARTSQGYGYCVFGEVTEGMDVLDQIAKAPLHDSGKFQGLPVETVAIKSVRQVR